MATIYFIHGFLGKPEDWEFQNGAFPGHQCHYLNLFRDETPINGLYSYASTINAQLTGNKNILVGYSLGGRLALHALLKNPGHWHAAVLISTHTGLPTQNERKMRLKRDQLWAERFLADDWETLISDWNRQPVLRSSAEIRRAESDFNRVKLARALQYWSLGHQLDLCDSIHQLSQPICWIAGEKDVYYCQLAKRLKFGNPGSQVVTIENAGHRVPWDQKRVFVDRMHEFLSHMPY